MTGDVERGTQLAEQLARGTVALALFAELLEHVEQYDADKREADDAYARAHHTRDSQLTSRIASSILRAKESLESIDKHDEIDDYDDD